jgi:hypothetical protein
MLSLSQVVCRVVVVEQLLCCFSHVLARVWLVCNVCTLSLILQLHKNTHAVFAFHKNDPLRVGNAYDLRLNLADDIVLTDKFRRSLRQLFDSVERELTLLNLCLLD